MAAPSVTYVFESNSTASASEVNQNFTDLVNALTDGNDDITVNTVSTNTVGEETSTAGVHIQGATDNNDIPTGYIGEKIAGSAIASNTSLSTTEATLSTLTLNKGIYAIYYSCSAYYSNDTGASDSGYTALRITQAGSLVGSSGRLLQPPVGASYSVRSTLAAVEYVKVAADSTDYLLRGKKVDNSGTGAGDIDNGALIGSVYFAIRVG